MCRFFRGFNNCHVCGNMSIIKLRNIPKQHRQLVFNHRIATFDMHVLTNTYTARRFQTIQQPLQRMYRSAGHSCTLAT